MSEFHINRISLQAFNDVLSRYPSTVQKNLKELDTLRYDTIPAQVASRQQNQDDTALITKGEVKELVRWKLKHGTFRPQLLSLVQSNPSEAFDKTTTKAFQLLEKIPDASPMPALKVLIGLKGIGPATASLLLSAVRPGDVPFFSDELFRWCCWDEPGKPGGWSRKIKYNVKEYEQLVGRVEEIVMRLGVRAVDVEKVAWVLGRKRTNIDGGEEGEETKQTDSKGEDEVEDKKAGKKTAVEKPANVKAKASYRAPTKGTKRKTREPISPVEGTRKKTRAKK